MSELTKADLADLIERGLKVPGVIEDISCYLMELNGKIHACAIGLAYIGLVGDAQKAQSIYSENRSKLTAESHWLNDHPLVKPLNINPYLLLDIGGAHHGGETAEAIAERLRKEHQENGS